jgi:hypothetical protein
MRSGSSIDEAAVVRGQPLNCSLAYRAHSVGMMQQRLWPASPDRHHERIGDEA